ncbi:MAG: hypothetical protein R3C10_06625 [Pirellulales bacterium]
MLSIEVVDAQTGEPIPRARVSVENGLNVDAFYAETGESEGTAEFLTEARTYGSHIRDRREQKTLLPEQVVKVSAEDHDAQCMKVRRRELVEAGEENAIDVHITVALTPAAT